MKFNFRQSGAFLALGLVLLTSPCLMYSQDFVPLDISDSGTYPQIIIRTKLGDIFIRLFWDTPMHRENFLEITKKGVLNRTTFHRIKSNEVIEGGDPNTKFRFSEADAGKGGPGYTLPPEILERYAFSRGRIGAFRERDEINPTRRSNGSRFFIVVSKNITDLETLKRYEKQVQQINDDPDFRFNEDKLKKYQTEGGMPKRDFQYTLFGEVVCGMEVVDSISVLETDINDRPFARVKMRAKVINPKKLPAMLLRAEKFRARLIIKHQREIRKDILWEIRMLKREAKETKKAQKGISKTPVPLSPKETNSEKKSTDDDEQK